MGTPPEARETPWGSALGGDGTMGTHCPPAASRPPGQREQMWGFWGSLAALHPPALKSGGIGAVYNKIR